MKLLQSQRLALEGFLSWLLNPEFVPQSQHTIRKRQRELLKRKDEKFGLTAPETARLNELRANVVYATRTRQHGGMSITYRRSGRSKGPGRSEETARLFVAEHLCRALYPGRKRFEALRQERRISECDSRAGEMRVRRFERTVGPSKWCEIAHLQFGRFKARQVHLRNSELFQGFPPCGIPRKNIRELTRLMQITKAESGLLRRIFEPGV
jgi:hypothetical protein